MPDPRIQHESCDNFEHLISQDENRIWLEGILGDGDARDVRKDSVPWRVVMVDDGSRNAWQGRQGEPPSAGPPSQHAGNRVTL